MVFLVYCGAAYTNETSRVYDLFMNFFVFPREICEVNKTGGGVSKNYEKNKRRPPVYFKPESRNTNLPIICEINCTKFFYDIMTRNTFDI